jgi:hypothetical protein
MFSREPLKNIYFKNQNSPLLFYYDQHNSYFYSLVSTDTSQIAK